MTLICYNSWGGGNALLKQQNSLCPVESSQVDPKVLSDFIMYITSEDINAYRNHQYNFRCFLGPLPICQYV